MANVVVIGAGIIGVTCAIELKKSGHDVTVMDRLPAGEGCSFGNAGILAASAFEPLAGPDTMIRVPGWLLDPESPLFIQWQYLPRLTPWLVRYAKAGMFGDMEAVREALYPLMSPCVELYRQLVTEAGAPSLIKQNGGLYAYTSRKKFEADRAVNDRRLSRGFRSEELDEQAIRSCAPMLSPAYKWGYLVHDIGHVTNPGRLVAVLADYAGKLGVVFEQASVLDIESGLSGPEKLITDKKPLDFDRLVVAAGAYSRELCRRIGDNIPLDTERGYHVMIRNPGPVPHMPVMDADVKAWITPMEQGLRCAGTVELASLDAPENHQRSEMLLKLAKRMVPGLQGDDYDVWMGRRPTLPDSIPVIGPATKVSSVFYAFGHHHLGLTGAPATAKIIAGLVSGRKPNRDISAYRADRF